jgi:hypothetical protein
LLATGIGQAQVLMPLQSLDQGGQKGNEPLATDAIGCMPGQEKSVLDFGPVLGLSPTPRMRL